MPCRTLSTVLGGTCLLALLAAGCGPKDALSADERQRARSALEKALTAWKAGEPLKKWADKSSPITVTEHDWKAGNKLADFSITSLRGENPGVARAVVNLSLQAPRGKSWEASALYAVDVTSPDRVTVMRDPMQ